MDETNVWIAIIRGEADGQEVRVALDFQDAVSLLSPSNFIVGESFINQVLRFLQLKDDWLVKTVIEEVRTPQGQPLPFGTPLFVILTKSFPRGLSAGALFIAEDVVLRLDEALEERPVTTSTVFNTSQRFVLTGLSPLGFAATCADDSRLFTRFISRLLKRPEGFAEVTMMLPRWFLAPSL